MLKVHCVKRNKTLAIQLYLKQNSPLTFDISRMYQFLISHKQEQRLNIDIWARNWETKIYTIRATLPKFFRSANAFAQCKSITQPPLCVIAHTHFCLCLTFSLYHYPLSLTHTHTLFMFLLVVTNNTFVFTHDMMSLNYLSITPTVVVFAHIVLFRLHLFVGLPCWGLEVNHCIMLDTVLVRHIVLWTEQHNMDICTVCEFVQAHLCGQTNQHTCKPAYVMHCKTEAFFLSSFVYTNIFPADAIENCRNRRK